MNTKLFLAIASATVTTALAVTPAMAATTTTTAPRRSTRTRDWETVAGVFRTEKAAQARVERLRADRLTGFVIERERNHGRMDREVEKPSSTRTAAAHEARLVRQRGFRSSVERS